MQMTPPFTHPIQMQTYYMLKQIKKLIKLDDWFRANKLSLNVKEKQTIPSSHLQNLHRKQIEP